MRRLVLLAMFSVAGLAAFAAPSLRASQAAAPLAAVQLHPVGQALNFILSEPRPETLAASHDLWATWYHMPRVHAVTAKANGKAASAPLMGRSGEAVSPPLSHADWCVAAMQGSVWVVDETGAAVPYVFVDARGPEQINCDAHFGNLSAGVKAATRRARFEPFQHPLGCDARPRPLMPWRTIATDPRRIATGTVLYIPELRGRGFWMDGRHYVHDGYVLAGDRGGAIRGAHIDIFVPENAGQPFPDLIASTPERTFAAHVVAPDAPAAVALDAASRELCRDIPISELLRRPWSYAFATHS